MAKAKKAKPAAKPAKQASKKAAKPAKNVATKKAATKKPAKQAAKPAKQAAKPAKQAAKPAKQAAKPAKQAAKPVKKPAKQAAAAPSSDRFIGLDPLTGEPVYAPDDADVLRSADTDTEAAATSSPQTIHLVRGAALVDQVMQQRRDRNDQLQGMSAGEIAAIDFGDKPLSPALARWLAADREMFTLGRPQPLMEMLEAEVGEWADAFVDLARYLTGDVVVFEGWGSDSRRFIYLGVTDDAGEYPVFTIDTDDTPYACLNGPVDMWLAQQAGFLPDEETYGEIPPAYEPVRAALAKKCFGGNIAYVDGQFSKQLDPYS